MPDPYQYLRDIPIAIHQIIQVTFFSIWLLIGLETARMWTFVREMKVRRNFRGTKDEERFLKLARIWAITDAYFCLVGGPLAYLVFFNSMSLMDNAHPTDPFDWVLNGLDAFCDNSIGRRWIVDTRQRFDI